MILNLVFVPGSHCGRIPGFFPAVFPPPDLLREAPGGKFALITPVGAVGYRSLFCDTRRADTVFAPIAVLTERQKVI